MDGKGYIKIPRSLLNEWQDKLTNEEVGILIYLTAMANYERKPKRAPKGDYLQRGQLVISIRWFANRFGISKSKAQRMLSKWESLGIIKRKAIPWTVSGTPSGTLLTLEFYAFSQGARYSDRDKSEDTIRNTEKDKKPSPSPALNGPDGEAGTVTGNLPDADRDQQPPGIIFLQI